jgi:hypothetical protein
MGNRSVIVRIALVVAALLALSGTAEAQCSGQPPGNQVCASPNGAAGLPGFRALVGADLPGVPLVVGTTTITGGTSGRIVYNAGGLFSEFVAGGDCTFTAPNFTCTKTNNVAFATSATTDATVATNIATGTLNSLRLDLATAANFRAAAANKVLAADAVFTSEVAVTYGATTAFDFATFINASVTLTGNITTVTFSNVKAGQAGLIRFIQDGTGSRTIPTTINSTLKCAGGCAYTLSTAANAVDVIPYMCTSATYCIGGGILRDVK